MPPPNLLAVFERFPRQLFRVNNGHQVRVRVWEPRRFVYDIFAQNGYVEPKARNPSTYKAPNGASLRPNSPYQQSLVRWRFRGDNVVVFSIPEGTTLPEDLLLVHERSDHYSLQPATTMTVEDLDFKINQFLTASAHPFTRNQWLKAYPEATENSGF